MKYEKKKTIGLFISRISYPITEYEDLTTTRIPRKSEYEDFTTDQIPRKTEYEDFTTEQIPRKTEYEDFTTKQFLSDTIPEEGKVSLWHKEHRLQSKPSNSDKQ